MVITISAYERTNDKANIRVDDGRKELTNDVMVERKIEKSLNALNALNGEQESERKPTESASYRTRSQTTNHSTNKQIL